MNNPAPELATVRDFLHQCLPFNHLNEQQLAYATSHLEVVYLRAGTRLSADAAQRKIRILRSGAVDIRSGAGQLLDRLGEKENFHLYNLAQKEPDIVAQAIEDTLLYVLDDQIHAQLRQNNRNFDRFFHSQRNRRLRRAVTLTPANNLLMGPIQHIMSHNAITVSAATQVQEAAQKMVAAGVSSLMVCEQERLVGIVTDRDLRSRLVAEGLACSTPIHQIMTRDPRSIALNASLFDALLLMSEHSIHHLPVVRMSGEQRVPCGMLTLSDLIRNREQDPVFLVQYIHKQTSLAGLQRAAATLPNLLTQWIDSGVRAYQLAQIFTRIFDAFTRRLIELAINELGSPPCRFSWLAFGSQGRAEQALGGDQDNALVFDDNAPPDADNYFKRMATWVCDGLNACGYVYCPGGIMANNELWRTSLANWQKTVDTWTDEPTPDAVMRVSIFFDIRCVYGERELADQLQAHMLAAARGNDIFLAALARNAGMHRPPLGFFRRFVLERTGEHAHQLDLKHRGIIPIVDLARVYALAQGISAVNTRERIRQLAETCTLTLADSRNLNDALEFIQSLRLQTHARQIADQQDVSNFLNPAGLPALQREQLRDAFTVIDEAQEALILKFSRGLST